MHDLAQPELARRAAEQPGQLRGVVRHEPARDWPAVGAGQLDRVAGRELALDAR